MERKKKWDLINTKKKSIPQIGFLIIPILYGMRFLLDHNTVFAVWWRLCLYAMATVICFCFFIMIDTLYVYHRPVFSPKKMTLNATRRCGDFVFLSSPKIKICDDLHTLYISLDNA